jgi:mono/diheme cytochrome c family protein
MTYRAAHAILGVLVCAAASRAADAGPSKPVDFVRDIRPILARSCLSCHDARKQRGGLRLDQRDAALRGGDSGAVLKPGDAAHSRLIAVVSGRDPEVKMPPAGKPQMTSQEIGLLRTWIDQGAKWPAGDAAVTISAKSDHWAFQPVKRPALPVVRNRSWPQSDIDAFVLARLEKEGLAPAPQADRPILLRRLSLDLLGLLPSPEEIDAFENDSAPDAYERLVDRLLASPHYGERWARHWLDLARYADSDGYEKDTGRPWAWRYRHWVIDALNRDLPYDQFVIEQLAGDLLPGATTEQKVATGLHRNTLTNKEGGVDQEQFRVEQVVDRVNTTARAFLGLTLGCAQCHDHKYDPFSQREYYRFFAFFNSDVETNISASLPGEPPPTTQGKVKQGTMAQTLALGKSRKTHVLIRGDFLRKGIEVEPGTPAVLPPLHSVAGSAKPANRLDLARWIARPDNPLTARVLVNWVWHKYFGRGIVPTIEDFGTQGERPSHPELLDHLADEFVRHRWSLKDLHRYIVRSAAYRQSSRTTPELLRRDPLNVLLARQSRMRLEAETVRDVTLAASGLLTCTIGGPSVRPPQPPGISELTYAGSARWIESKGTDRYRRGLYIWFQRTSPYPMLMTFDAPDSNLCCVRRERSNTPLQALTLLNDTVFVECARALGQRLASLESHDPAGRIRHAFRLCLTREPTDRELSRLVHLLGEFRELCRDQPQEVVRLAGVAKGDVAEMAAWVALARVLLNLDEFVTRE